MRIVRIVAGVAAVALLAYVWLPRTQNAGLFLAIVSTGLTGGLLMGSWWSLALVPATAIVTGMLQSRIACPDCPPGREPPILVATLLAVSFYDLGAAAGTLGAKFATRARRPNRPAAR